METKTFTLRLPAEQAAEIEMIARVDDISVTQAVRDAIVAHVNARRVDADFMGRLKGFMEQERAVLDRLAQ
jgi:hypothetical protein